MGTCTLISKKKELERGNVEPETDIKMSRTMYIRKSTPANTDVVNQPRTSD